MYLNGNSNVGVTDRLAAGVYGGDGELGGDIGDHRLDSDMVGGGTTEWDDGREMGGPTDKV